MLDVPVLLWEIFILEGALKGNFKKFGEALCLLKTWLKASILIN